jgi:hypothetical protein
MALPFGALRNAVCDVTVDCAARHTGVSSTPTIQVARIAGWGV